jgi:hypothetical protein
MGYIIRLRLGESHTAFEQNYDSYKTSGDVPDNHTAREWKLKLYLLILVLFVKNTI